MIRNLSKFTVVALSALVLSASSLFAGAPVSAGTVDIKAGATSLTLADAFAGVLELGSVSVDKVIPGKVNTGKGKLTFPVSGGVVDTATAQSEITHSGGFSLSTGSTKVSLTDFVISTPESTNAGGVATLSALVTVNGAFQGRVTLFELDLSGSNLGAPVTVPKNKILTISDVGIKLTDEGAAALSAAFSTMIPAGTIVGTAEVKAITVKGSL